jgi:hypothetical protein
MFNSNHLESNKSAVNTTNSNPIPYQCYMLNDPMVVLKLRVYRKRPSVTSRATLVTDNLLIPTDNHKARHERHVLVIITNVRREDKQSVCK